MPVNSAAKRAETITTSLGQHVDATVLNFKNSPLRFDQLVTSINESERLLGVPFPSPNVTLKKVDWLSGGFCGHNQMSYAPRYVGRPYVVDGSVISVRIDEDCDATFRTIVHEVAHTWFHGSNARAEWIDEGLANVIELQVVAANQPSEVLYPPVTYCEDYRNIRELEQAAPPKVSNGQHSGFSCNYSFGDGIFGALGQHYGDKGFNQRIAELARRPVSQTDREHTIADVRKVLGGDTAAMEIIDTWYEGYPQTRNYWHLDAVEWTFPPTVDGDYLHFAGTIDQTWVVHDFTLSDDPYCSQFVLYQGVGDEDWVESVSDPLPAGWTHDEDSTVVTVNHRISQDTGEFQVTARILEGFPINLSDLSLIARSRVTSGADGLCNEGVIYSQVPVLYGKIPTEFKQTRFYHLDAVEWTFPPTIDGEFLYFAGRTTEPGLVHDFILGDDPYCSQFSLYRNVINQEWVTSIGDPLLAAWKHSEFPDIVVVNDKINVATGEFSVTARINYPALADIPALSLLVSSRVEADEMNTCGDSDSYSQVPVSIGTIPTQFKMARHYHLDAIQWFTPPTIHGNTMTFSGRADPGSVGFEWREGYCSQFAFYERDERGYHYIDSLDPFLPGDSYWTGPITGEVTSYRTGGDGTFEATAQLSDNALYAYLNPLLVVISATAVDQATNKCGDFEVLSAIDLH